MGKYGVNLDPIYKYYFKSSANIPNRTQMEIFF